MGFWMTVQGNSVTGTVLLAMEFRIFVCARYNVTPHNLKKWIVSLITFPYITDLDLYMEGSSSHIMMRWVTISSTLHGKPYPLTMYV